MTTIRVNASRIYDVTVENGLLAKAGEMIRALPELCGAERAVIVTEDRVDGLWGEACEQSLVAAGFQVDKFVFPHGEESKNFGTLTRLLEMLASIPLTRTDVLVALGGGVVGDLTGFAAAIYLRGIPFVQIPTTLLAAVDASVGGKTAVDLAAGKNLAGCFWQPSAVLCDPALMETCTKEVFADGCAEVIKYGMISDLPLLERLEEWGPGFPREQVVAACVADKRDTVEADETDTGVRRLLNFGHTAGHAVERLSSYQISHGSAVAIGMALITRSAAAEGLCPPDLPGRLENLLVAFGLPVECPYSASELARVAATDKKRTGGTVALVVPREAGRCEILPVAAADLEAFFAKGLKK